MNISIIILYLIMGPLCISINNLILFIILFAIITSKTIKYKYNKINTILHYNCLHYLHYYNNEEQLGKNKNPHGRSL